MGANFPYILHKRTYFFYFTHLILQNIHINLSIIHIYSIKYSFFYHFLLFSSLPLPPSQAQPPLSLLPDRRTIQDQTIPRSENHSRSNQPEIRNPFNLKPLNLKPKSSHTHPLDFLTHHHSGMRN